MSISERQQLEVMEGFRSWPCGFSCFYDLLGTCILKICILQLPVLLAKFAEVVTADKATNTDLVRFCLVVSFVDVDSSPQRMEHSMRA